MNSKSTHQSNHLLNTYTFSFILFHFWILLFNLYASFSQSRNCITIGGDTSDLGTSIIQTSDGGFAIAGATASFGEGIWDVYVMKLDSAGSLQWPRTIGGTDVDWAESIIQTADQGYAMVGKTFNTGVCDVYLVKLDSAGNMEWTRTLGNDWIDAGYSLLQADDGGYILTGGYSNNQNDIDLFIAKFNSYGNLQWNRTVGGTSDDAGFSIVNSVDGGYIVAGSSNSFGAGNKDAFIVKFDYYGNVIWSRTVGGVNDDHSFSIVSDADGGYAVAGYTNSFGAGGNDFYLIKLDSAGNLQWTSVVGGAGRDEAYSLAKTNDDGFLLAGVTNSFGVDSNDVYLVKINSNGKLLWTKTMGGVGNQAGISIILTKEGTFALAGVNDNQGTGYKDVLFVLLDSAGNTCCATGIGGSDTTGGIINNIIPDTGTGGYVNSIGFANSGGTLTMICSDVAIEDNFNTVNDKLIVYPNPSGTDIIIECNMEATVNGLIVIRDILGKNVNWYELDLGARSIVIKAHEIDNGVYFLALYRNSIIKDVCKLVVAKH